MNGPDDGYHGGVAHEDVVCYSACMAAVLISSLGKDGFHGFMNEIEAGARDVM